MSPDALPPAVIEARGVEVMREGRNVVDGVSLAIRGGSRWIVLGPNGCGKSTLMSALALRTHPSAGAILVEGRPLGSFDVRGVRFLLPCVSASLAGELRPAMRVLDAVMSGVHGALETWWHEYTDADSERALAALGSTGAVHLALRSLSTLSSGELQRVLLARALVVEPLAVLLDEPSARLDVAGRETLVDMLERLARRQPELPSVVVTHHVDEIPPSATHCLLMRNGRATASGAIHDVLTAESLSECFGLDLRLDRRANGRWTAYAA